MSTYPWEETGVRVLLDLDGDGTYEEDVTEYLHVTSDGVAVKIGRGMLSEGGTVTPATATLTLIDPDLRFSPRNPEGPYYGQLVRNTPIAIDVSDSGGGRDVRYVGVVPRWHPVLQAHDDDDALVQITAYDVRRRIGRTSARLASAYTRACVSQVAPIVDLVAYWSLEASSGATQLGGGLAGLPSAQTVGGVRVGADSDSFACSDALPTFVSASAIQMSVPSYTDTGEWQIMHLLSVPSDGVPADTRILRVFAESSAAHQWSIHVNTAGNIRLVVLDETTTVTALDTGWLAFQVNGEPSRIYLAAWQAGSDIRWTLARVYVDPISGGYWNWELTAPITSATLGRATSVTLSPDGGLIDCSAGQVTVQNSVTSVYDFYGPLNGYAGETAEQRIDRLCTEAAIPLEVTSSGGQGLGAQRPGTLLAALTAAEQADGGVLYSPRDDDGLAYRSTLSMCTQTPTVDEDYDSVGVVTSAPVEDDQHLRNQVTITRPRGGSAMAEDSTGPLGTQDPPDGAGLYDMQAELHLGDDHDLIDRAGWEVHLGTVPAPRFPGITFDLGAAPFALADDAGLDALKTSILSLDVGDRVTLTDPPSWIGVHVIDQIVIGLREGIGPWVHTVTVTGRPAAPYSVARYEDDDDPGGGQGRASVPGTVLAEDLDATETGVDITAPADCAWAHDDGDYDIEVGGEHMTVTGISGTAPSYTLTVTRSVNGVTKTHSSGDDVNLATPYYCAI